MNPVPPKLLSPSAWFIAVITAAAAAMIAAVVYFFNPSTTHIYPVCQFHQLTGLNCPGCGGTRALYALLHGHAAAAFRDNALLVVSLPLLAARGGWLAWNRWRGRPGRDFFPVRFLLPLVAVMVVFGILRNLPAFSFLSPYP